MSSLHRNSLWLLIARLTAQGLAILFIAIIARQLGVERFGQFTVIGAVVLIGNTFTNFGTDTLIIREVSLTREPRPLLAQTFSLQLLLSVLWWILTFILRPGPALLIYSLALFPLAVFSIATAALRAFERMDLVWILSLANGLVQVLFAFVSNDLWTLCILLLVGHCLIAVLSFWICYVSVPAFNLLPFHSVFPLLKLTLPFAVLTLLLVLSQRLGVLSVSYLLGDAATGLFSSVTRVVDGLKLGHYAILGALLPVISQGSQESKHYFRKGFIFLMAISSVMAVGLSIFPRLILLGLYGMQYASGSLLLTSLGWSLIPYTISSFISYDLIARRQENVLVKATGTSVIILFILYFWLISAYDLRGATYAALFGEILQAGIFIVFRARSATDLPQVQYQGVQTP